MNVKTILALVGLSAVLLIATAVLAAGDIRPEDHSAPQVAANGPKDIPPGWDRIVFIHYRKGHGKPDGTPGKKPPKSDSNCYGFIARGAKWTEGLPIAFQVDASNSGLTEDSVRTAFTLAADEWDSYTGVELLDEPDMVTGLTVNPNEYNTVNEIAFQDYPEEGVIAVTIVWGIFGGPPAGRRIVEFDMIMDTDYAWGDADYDSGVMDVWNIATHELGHALGLDDVYQSECSEVTMYGYSTEGDIAKRDLAPPDITGLQELYGN